MSTMKKTLLALFFVGCYGFMVAQIQTQQDLALRYLEEKSEDWKLEKSDIQNVLVSDAYQDRHNLVSHIYLNQSVQNIPIFNALAGVHITKDGKVAYANHRFINDAVSKINGTTPTIEAVEAIKFAAQHLEQEFNNVALIEMRGNNEYLFEAADFTFNEIPVALKFQPVENGQLKLAWDLSLQMRNSSDYWSIRVDAMTGEILDQNNWTVYCKVEGGMFHKHDHSCGAGQVHKHQSSFKSASAVAGESYRVFALPAESPIHGDHVLVTEPQNEASPWGWHDINGNDEADYFTLRGNNTHTFLDADDNFLPDGDEPVDMDLNFDFPFDSQSEPGGVVDAALVNLFYMNNIMHDLTYQIGFT